MILEYEKYPENIHILVNDKVICQWINDIT